MDDLAVYFEDGGMEELYETGFDPLEELFIENFAELQSLKEADTEVYNRKTAALVLDILDMDKYIKDNELEKKQVTNPVFFNRGNQPTSDGLLSNEIFGITKEDRAGTVGWIDLKGTYLDPSCYKQLCKIDKRIKNIVHHIDNYSVDPKGNIVEDEKGSTGITFLKKNIDKIKFKKSGSVQRDLRIQYIEKNKKKMFINKFPVIPPYYRDVDTSSGKTDVGAINKLYAAVLSNVVALQNTQDMGFFDNTGALMGMVQERLLQIYNWFVGNTNDESIEKGTGISGKFGILRRANMSKTTDYTSRLVISSTNLKTEYVDDIKINVDNSGIPLAVAISNYKPYVLFYLKNFFQNEFNVLTNYPVTDEKGREIYMTPKNPETVFSDERLEEEMARFLHGYQNRLIPIEIPVEETDKTVYMVFRGRSNKQNFEQQSIFKRRLTWCDVLFMAAYEATKDKNVLITRYPIESAYNQVPTHIVVLSTTETEPIYINDEYYPYYPVIKEEDIGKDTSNMFEDTLQLSNLLLKGLNGDYDGDTSTVKSVYTQEANAEIDAFMQSKLNYIDLGGVNIKLVTGDSLQSIYNLTKILPDNEKQLIDPVF